MWQVIGDFLAELRDAAGPGAVLILGGVAMITAASVVVMRERSSALVKAAEAENTSVATALLVVTDLRTEIERLKAELAEERDARRRDREEFEERLARLETGRP